MMVFAGLARPEWVACWRAKKGREARMRRSRLRLAGRAFLCESKGKGQPRGSVAQWLIIQGRLLGKLLFPLGAVAVTFDFDALQQPQPDGCLSRV